MRGLRLYLTIGLVIALCIGIGVAWGLKIRNDRLVREATLKDKPLLNILALKGVIPPTLPIKFEANSGIRVRVTEAATPEELWKKLETSLVEPPTLVTLFSFQIPLANQMTKLQAIPFDRIQGMRGISPDLREIPDNPGFSQSMPLIWGFEGLLTDTTQVKEAPESWADVLKLSSAREPLALPSSTTAIARLAKLESAAEAEGMKPRDLPQALNPVMAKAKFSDDPLSPASLFKDEKSKPKLAYISHGETAFAPFKDAKYSFSAPAEGYNLWILSLSLSAAATKEQIEIAIPFLEFLLTQESALEIINHSHQASANRETERTDVDKKLKPSYMRQVPLNRYSIGQDFNRSREIRELINKD